MWRNLLSHNWLRILVGDYIMQMWANRDRSFCKFWGWRRNGGKLFAFEIRYNWTHRLF